MEHPEENELVQTTFELRGVDVRRSRSRLLESIELAIAPGEAVAVVGPSGAGKTTLLRLLNGSLRPSAGSVRFQGRDLASLRPAELRDVRARIGFVHQDHSLVPNLRVAPNVIAGRMGQRGTLASLRSMLLPSRADLEEAHGLLERLGIEDKLFQRVDALSGGEQQRVALARALFQHPVALLADEPVASVDPARARALVELMCALAGEQGLTLMASLHDLALAREFFPRTIGLRDGRLWFDRPTREIETAEFDELYRLEPEARRDPEGTHG